MKRVISTQVQTRVHAFAKAACHRDSRLGSEDRCSADLTVSKSLASVRGAVVSTLRGQCTSAREIAFGPSCRSGPPNRESHAHRVAQREDMIPNPSTRGDGG